LSADHRFASADRRFDVAILAGGRSRRMGRDKAALLLEGRTLLDRQLALAWSLAPEEVWVSGRAQAELGGVRARGLPDESPGQGPLGGLVTVLRATRAAHVLVLAVDMPALDAGLLARLLARRTGATGVVPRTRAGWEPLAAVYPRALLGPAEAALVAGRRALHGLVEAAIAAGQLAAWDVEPADEAAFTNWNEPGELPADLRGR
jgi:molybdopterin-guanine dinucleotide biosynthesis protein A